MLRGDSTLRAHLLEEYEAVRDAVFPAQHPVHLLVPAHPVAGRVTLGGRHLSVEGGMAVAMHETEFGRDPHLGYGTSDMLEWAHERSSGYFDHSVGTRVDVERLRREGHTSVLTAIEDVARTGKPGVCVPDCETLADLDLIAEGLDAARSRGLPVLVRCAPPFVGVVGGVSARSTVPLPLAPAGALVVCGSWVQGSSRQVRALERWAGRPAIEVDIDGLLGDRGAAVLAHVALEASAQIARHGWSIVATPRHRVELTEAEGRRLAERLGQVVGAIAPRPDLVAVKGGITSAAVVREGFGAALAWVEGPVTAGVSLWRLGGETSRRVIVVPGNVGDDDLLMHIVKQATNGRGRARVVP